MAKKATIAQQQNQENQEKKGTRITAMMLGALSYFTARQYDAATEEEKQCEATFDKTIIDSLVNYKDPKTGNVSPLLEIKEDGTIVATPFGVRWVLQSTQFGVNFNRLFEHMSVPALHSAFLALSKRLSDAHAEVPIHFFAKDGSKNPFYSVFMDAVNAVDNCLEAQPEETTN